MASGCMKFMELGRDRTVLEIISRLQAKGGGAVEVEGTWGSYAPMLAAYVSKKLKRPNWDEYFLKMAHLVAERSTCLRHHVGAVIVKNRRILTTGYNGAASGVKDCIKLGCLRNEQGIPSGEWQLLL